MKVIVESLIRDLEAFIRLGVIKSYSSILVNNLTLIAF